MKYNPIMHNGVWRVKAGRNRIFTEVFPDEESARIFAVRESAIWHYHQWSKLDMELEDIDPEYNLDDPKGYLC